MALWLRVVDHVSAVQVHGRVAVARQQAYDLAEEQINEPAIYPNQHAVFVSSKFEHEVIPPKYLRWPSVAADGLPAYINNDTVQHRPVDHTTQNRGAERNSRGRPCSSQWIFR